MYETDGEIGKHGLYLDMSLHVLVQVVNSAVVLHFHVCLRLNVGCMAEGWVGELDALRLAVDHLGHLHRRIFRGRGRSRLGSSAGDGSSH